MTTADTPCVMIAIPVYNHAATLRGVVESVLDVCSGLHGTHARVLVVDDGSSDDVTSALEGVGNDVILLTHEINQGKGTAILTAAAEARRQGASHLLTLDADGQHDAADIPKFIKAVLDEPFALYVGARDFEVANVPGASRFGRKFSNFWLRVHTGQKLSDSQSGFRCYPLEVFEHLRWWQTRYAFEVEVLVKSAWAGVPLRDVDIRVYYAPKGERVSHFDGLWDNVRISLLNTLLTMRCLLPWPHKRLAAKKGGKVSVVRPLRSLKMLLREGFQPRELALSGGLGVLIGALPLFGVQTVTVLATASYVRLNKLVALATNQLCMPPIVPALCVELGFYLRNGHFLTEISLETLGYQALDRVFEWLLGGLVLGPVMALVLGSTIYVLSSVLKLQVRALKNVGNKKI